MQITKGEADEDKEGERISSYQDRNDAWQCLHLDVGSALYGDPEEGLALLDVDSHSSTRLDRRPMQLFFVTEQVEPYARRKQSRSAEKRTWNADDL